MALLNHTSHHVRQDKTCIHISPNSQILCLPYHVNTIQLKPAGNIFCISVKKRTVSRYRYEISHKNPITLVWHQATCIYCHQESPLYSVTTKRMLLTDTALHPILVLLHNYCILLMIQCYRLIDIQVQKTEIFGHLMLIFDLQYSSPNSRGENVQL